MHSQRSTAAIILAAGSSSRMGAGRHKLLLPLNERPVLAHVIEAALESQARPIIVVLGHQAEQVRAQLTHYSMDSVITYVENPDYLQGMSTSMRVGLTYLQNQMNAEIANVDSALILLGDQPLVTARMLDTLVDTWHMTGKPIVAPLYAGKRGNPTLFAESLFPELLQVPGDEGGRSVVERHRQELATVELGDAVANYDVDTWEAYQQVVELWQQRKIQ